MAEILQQKLPGAQTVKGAPYYVKYKKWWDTKHFAQAGQFWMRDGEYCPFPEGTPAYYEYWDEQEYFIKNGFTHDGQHIQGLNYLYLNYCPIKDKKAKTVKMPDFWALDAEYWDELCKAIGLTPNPDQFRPVIWEVAKTRQCGASLKNVVPVFYNMCFVPFSQNYIGAYLKADTEKTVNMFLNYFYHAQKYTEFGKRFINKQAYEYYRTGYFDIIDGDQIPSGFQSELRIITWKDNPEKGVGGACDLFVVEESGLHPYLLTSLGYIIPACKDGDYTTGNIIVFGAAGKEGQCEGLGKLHNNPSAYNAVEYDNIWEPDSYYKRTGYFIPNYACRKGHMDADGNPNQASAIDARQKALDKVEKVDYDQFLLDSSQYPNKPSEMFSTRGRKRFNQKLIKTHIAFLEANMIRGQAVELIEDPATGIIHRTFVDEKIARPIRRYPLLPDMDKAGCIEIFEEPNPNAPFGLYIGGIDSYNQENSQDSTSLGSVFIYKKVSGLENEGTFRLPVAEYTGRPESKYDFYRACAYLAKYYNATLLLENEDQEAAPWFVNNKYDEYLADQPDLIRGYILDSKVKRNKGIHAVEPLIIAAENKIQRYLDENLGFYYDDQGQVSGIRKGVSRIMSLGLLYELAEYVHDNNKNFDRVRAFGWALLYEDETQNIEVRDHHENNVAEFLVNTARFGPKRRYTNGL